MSQYQYQQEVGPFTTSAPSETLPDQWMCQAPPPVRRKPASALLIAAMVVPIFVPLPQDAPQTCDRWKPNYPDRIERTRLPRAAHLTFAQNIDPLPPVIASSSGGSFISTGAYTLWQYQSIAGPLVETSATPDVLLNWQPVYPDAIRQKTGLRAALHPAWVMDQFAAPTAATVPDWGWAFIPPDQARGRAASHYKAPSFSMDTQWTAPAQNSATSLWMPKGVDRPLTRVYPQAIYTWAEPHFVVEVDVPVMSWTGLYLDPPMKARSPRFLFGTRIISPFQIPDVTDPAPILSWSAYQPEQARRATNSIAAKTATEIGPVFVADVVDPTPTLAWQGRYADRADAKRSLGAANQKSWFMDAIYTAPTPATAPALAKPVYPDRVPGKTPPALHPDYKAPEFVLDVTVPAPPLSWAPTYPSFATITMRKPELLPAEVFTIRPPRHFKVGWAKGTTKIYGPTRPTNPEED